LTISGCRPSRSASTDVRSSAAETVFGSMGSPMRTCIGAGDQRPPLGSTSAVPVSATGTIGTPLVRRLTAAGEPVRCLVRDPRRLGPERVRVQIALGDLAEPGSFRNAMRGVKTVVHLGAAIRDQERASIEELNGVATMRLVRSAEQAGAEHFVFFSAINATLHSRSRFLRSKALAERAVERDTWRSSAEDLLAGLGKAIDERLSQWGLTPVEREVALQLLKGKSHKQIAYGSGRSERTVRQHAVAVYQKSGLNGRAELAAFFLEGIPETSLPR